MQPRPRVVVVVVVVVLLIVMVVVVVAGQLQQWTTEATGTESGMLGGMKVINESSIKSKSDQLLPTILFLLPLAARVPTFATATDTKTTVITPSRPRVRSGGKSTRAPTGGQGS